MAIIVSIIKIGVPIVAALDTILRHTFDILETLDDNRERLR
jgi:hypothetical protein